MRDQVQSARQQRGAVRERLQAWLLQRRRILLEQSLEDHPQVSLGEVNVRRNTAESNTFMLLLSKNKSSKNHIVCLCILFYIIRE